VGAMGFFFSFPLYYSLHPKNLRETPRASETKINISPAPLGFFLRSVEFLVLLTKILGPLSA
jgi:hypothetical protein